MRIALTKYALFLYLSLSFFAAFGQNALPQQQNAGKLKFNSDFAYLFKVPEDSVLDYGYKGKIPDPGSNWLREPSYVIISNKTDSLLNSPQIVQGSYLIIRVNEGKLNYNTVNTSPLSCNLVNMEQDRLLIVKDKAGNLVDDAIVKLKGKIIPFNRQLMAFLIEPGQNDTLEIRSGASLQYVIARKNNYNNNNNYRNRYYENQTYYQSPEYRGYLVTHQPSYKPGDTLKYKAHLLNKAGKPATDTLELQVQDYYQYKKMHLQKIIPQAPGVYFGEFVLGDSLLPDRQYALELFHTKKGTAISQRFNVEDYLLDDTYLKVKSENLKQYQQGDSIILYAFAHNANGLPLTDGEIDLWVLRNSFTPKPVVPQVYVPDTLYRAKLIANPEGDTKIAFSTAIFPEVKNMSFTIKLRLRNTQAEQKDTLFTLYYAPQENYFRIEEQDNKVKVQLIKNKQSIIGKGYWYNNKDSMLVHYPLELDIKANDVYYQFTAIDDSGRVQNRDQISLKSREPFVTEQYVEDTAIFKVTNPKQKLIRYSIFKGNDLWTKGTVAEDTLIKIRTAHNETVTFQYVYESNNNFEKLNSVAFKLKSRINIKLSKKDIIYPGQTDLLELSVQDAEKKAIAGLNMTVLAFNANFKEDFVPQLSSAGLIEPGLKAATEISYLSPISLSTQTTGINPVWAKNLSLDTAYFYKNIFLSKAPYTKYVYPTQRKDIAQLAVYIKLGNTYMIPEYIMEDSYRPLYVKKATITTNPNAVGTFSGKRNIWVRTPTQLFKLYQVDLEQGKKTILFINPDTLAHRNQRISSVEKMNANLLSWEQEVILRHTLQINNETGRDYTIRQSNTDFTLSRSGSYSAYNNYYNYGDDYGYINNAQNYHMIAPIDFNNDISYFQQGNLKITFRPEPGYNYAIRPGMFRMEKMKPEAYLQGSISPYGLSYNFSEELAPLLNWDSLSVNPVPKKQERQRSRSITFNGENAQANSGIKTLLQVNTSGSKVCAGALFLPHDKKVQPFVLSDNRSLPFALTLTAGRYDIHIYWNDSTFSSTKNIALKPYGTNAVWIAEQDFSTKVPKEIIPYINLNYYVTKGIARHIRQPLDGSGQLQLNGWITDEKDRKLNRVNIELSAGEQILAKTRSDRNGRFSLDQLEAATMLLKFSGKGLKDQVLEIRSEDLGPNGLNFKIVMEAKSSVFKETIYEFARQMLETFVDDNTGTVLNYGDVPEDKNNNFEVSIFGKKIDRRTYTGSINSVSSQESHRPMRGNLFATASDMSLEMSATSSNAAPPMPGIRGGSSGAAETEVLKDNGSVFGTDALLNTQKGNDFIADFLNNMQSASGMRRNFRDWAIWEPNLWTDKDGKAKFSVQYPDNTTAWKTYVLTMDKNGLSASHFSLTKAFKPLSASLSLPAFLRYGDSVELIGKVINHTGKSFKLQTRFKSLNLDTSFAPVEVQNGKIEQQFIAASFINSAKDTSITASYQLNTEDKYEDGEEKTIPVYPVGLVERKGFFTAVLGDTTIRTKASDIDLPFTGNVYVSMEGNLLEVMLSEIEQLKIYPHGCTEQMTSKLLSVYYEEKVKKILGSTEFNNTKEKKEILAKLIAAQNPDGSFGWFGGNSADFRVTNYVLSTLQKLEDNNLSPVLNKGLYFLNYNLSRMNTQDLISSLSTLAAAGYPSNYEKELERIKKEKLDTYSRLAVIKISKERKLPYRAALDSMMLEGELSRQGLKWGNKSYDWYRNELAATLLAYEIIKADSIYSIRKKDIIMYLLSKRTNGYYQNTAESGLILTTLLPDMIVGNIDRYAKREPTIVVLSGAKNDTIKTFPVYMKINDKNAQLDILKQGLSPVYISVAYEYFNQAPETKKGSFNVSTSFLNKKDQSKLEQGEVVTMRVAVEVKDDAEYVMIEAPLPAGCVVRNKNRTNAYESSRANFKEKTSIYCGYLPKGSHYFDIELQARYKGSFTINPASASLMYYADQQGNNEVKQVWIK